MMKYSVNHPYKFESYMTAFSSAFSQFWSSISIEIANIIVICCTADTLSIISNFVALVIIAEFDNYVFSSMKDESFRLLIENEFTEKAFVIEHTSSKKCSQTELSNQKDENGEIRPLKITYKSRTCPNRWLLNLYKFLRTFYVSCYFYFMPFVAMIMTTALPFLLRGYEFPCPSS